MGTDLNNEDLTKLSWQERNDIANFTGLNRELKRIQARLAQARPVIAQLEMGLPEGIRIVAKLQYMTGHDSYPPTVIYHRSEDDEVWREHGRVVAVGGHQEFFGDGGFVTDDGVLVVTDFQAGVGISVDAGGTVDFIDLANDKNARTLGGSSPERHKRTLELLADVPADGEEHFDCMYY